MKKLIAHAKTIARIIIGDDWVFQLAAVFSIAVFILFVWCLIR